jgi:hypothetical protein
VRERTDCGGQQLWLKSTPLQLGMPGSHSAQQLDPPPIGIVTGKPRLILQYGIDCRGLSRNVRTDPSAPEPQPNEPEVGSTRELNGSRGRQTKRQPLLRTSDLQTIGTLLGHHGSQSRLSCGEQEFVFHRGTVRPCDGSTEVVA